MNLINTGFLLTALGAGAVYLKKVPEFLYNEIKKRLIYNVRLYQYDELFDMVEMWLAENYKEKYRSVEACAFTESGKSFDVYSQNDDKIVVRYKQESNVFNINYKGKRLIFDKTKEKLDKAESIKNIFMRTYSISGIKAKSKIDELLQEAILLYESKKEKDCIKVYTNNSYGDWGCLGNIKPKSLLKTIIDKDKKSLIINDLDKFNKGELWYSDISVPYKRGYCFYGPPGTGKTTLALALASYTKKNIFCLNLNSIEDERLASCFSSIHDNSVLLIEDIDKIFSGRESVNGKSKITFSSLLNCLDGAFYKHGLITIITTNHIEKLDEALLRTGRIDIKIEISNPGYREISEYMSLFYNEPIEVIGDFDLKMSDVQELCLNHHNSSLKAIRELYTKYDKGLSEHFKVQANGQIKTY